MKLYDFWNILLTEFDSQIIAYFIALSVVGVSLGRKRNKEVKQGSEFTWLCTFTSVMRSRS